MKSHQGLARLTPGRHQRPAHGSRRRRRCVSVSGRAADTARVSSAGGGRVVRLVSVAAAAGTPRAVFASSRVHAPPARATRQSSDWTVPGKSLQSGMHPLQKHGTNKLLTRPGLDEDNEICHASRTGSFVYSCLDVRALRGERKTTRLLLQVCYSQ